MFTSARGRPRVRSFIRGLATIVAAVLLISGITVSTAQAAVTPLDNPTLTPSCGQNVAIVVDLSSSMEPWIDGHPDPNSSLAKLKTAAIAYVETLKGTTSKIALFTFGTAAPNVGDSTNNYSIVNANHPLTSVQTQDGVDQLEGWIKGWRGYGWTRWDLGLQQVADSPEHYDFVLFITDGYPTDDHGNTITNSDGIITAANNVKAEGTKIIVVYAATGAGAALNAAQRANVIAISGPTTGQANVLLNDYYETDWSNMVLQFQALATMCTPTTDIEATRTIHYVDANGATMAPDAVQTVSYTKMTNLLTGEVTYTPENPSFEPVASPVIPRYTPDKPSVGSAAVPVTADPPDLEVTVVYTPNTVSTITSTLELNTTSTTAGGTVVATVTARDSGNYAMADVPVIVTVDKSATLGDAKEKSYTCTTTSPNGTCSVTLTDKTAETVTVTAKIDDKDITGSPATVTFTEGDLDPSNSTFQVSVTDPAATSVVADGAQSWTGTLVAKDSSDNLLSDLHLTDIHFNVNSSLVTVSNVENKGNGVYEVTYTSEKAGSYTASLVYQTSMKIGDDLPIAFVPGPVDARNSSVAVAPPTQTVGAQAKITVTVRDATNNPIPGLTAADMAVAGTAAGLPDLTLSNFQETASGVYTYDATSKLVGDFEVAAQVKGVGLTQKPHVSFTPGKVCVSNCEPVGPWNTGNLTRIEMVDNDRLADGSQQDSAKAYAYDTYGNPVPGATVAITDKSTGDLVGILNPQSQSKTTGDDGTVMFYWTSTTADLFTAEGTIDTLEPQKRVLDVRFTTGAADPSKSELIVTPASPIIAGNSYTAMAIVRDATGNPVAKETVSFSLDPASPATLGAPSCTTDSRGTCSVTVSSDLIATTAVHATVVKNGAATDLGGNGVDGHSSPQTVSWIAGPVCVVNCTPVDPTHITRVEVVIDGVQANGQAADTAQVWAYDRLGNPVSNQIVASTTTDSALAIGAPIPRTGQDGTTLIEYRSLSKGAHPATVTIAGLVPVTAKSKVGVPTTNGSITLNFSSDTVDPSNSFLTIEPGHSQLVGSTFTVTAHALDANGNGVEGAVVDFPDVASLDFTTATGADFSDGASCTSRADGTCEVRVSSKLVGDYTVSGMIGAQPVSNTVTAQFTVGEVCVDGATPVVPGNVTRVRVTLDGRTADGDSRDVATVWAYDCFGNAVPGATVMSSQEAGKTGLTVQPASQISPTGPDGTTTIWYTATAKGAYKADVMIGGKVPVTSPITLNFGNGDGSLDTSSWVIAPAGPLIVGQGAENTYTATATVRDPNRNAVPDAVVTFAIDPEGPEFSSMTCTTDPDGVCSVTVSSTRSGTYAVTAEIPAGYLTNSTTRQQSASVIWNSDEICSQAEGCETVDPTLPDRLRTRVEILVDDQVADGNAKDSVTVWAFDKWGNPAEGALVRSTTTDSGLNVQTGISPIGPDGSTTIWYTASTDGTYHASVLTGDKRPVGSPVELHFKPQVCVEEAGDTCSATNQTHVEVTRPDQKVGDPDQVTAYAYNAAGEPVGGVVFVFAKVDPSDPMSIAPQCTTQLPSGTCTVDATATAPGEYQATASVNGVELVRHGSPLKLAFISAACVEEAGDTCPAADKTRVEVTLNDQAVGGTPDQVTAYARNTAGDPVGGVTFTFAKANPSDPMSIAAQCTTALPSGTCTVDATATKVGAFRATASVGGQELTRNGSPVELRFGACLEEAGHTCSSDNQTHVAVTRNEQVVGTNSDQVTAYAYGASGQPLEGVVFTFAKVDPSDPYLIEAECTTLASGTCLINANATEAGSYQATASVNGVPLNEQHGSPVTLVFTPRACVEEAGDICPASDKTRVAVTTNDRPVGTPDVITAYARDDKGTPVGGVTFTFVKGVAGDDLAVGASCQTTLPTGTCTVEGNSSTPGAYTVRASANGIALNQDHGSPLELRFTSGAICLVERGDQCASDKTRVAVTANDAKVGGSDTVTAYARDKDGFPVDNVTFIFVKSDSGDDLVIAGSCTTTLPAGTCTVNGTSQTAGAHPVRALVGTTELLQSGSPMDLRFLGAPAITSPKNGDTVNDDPLVITGTGQNEGDTIVVTDKNGDEVCRAQVTASKTWSCSKSLSDGEHTLTAVEQIPGGNTSDPSAPVTVVLDTAKPAAPTITGPKDGDKVGDNTPTVTGTGEEPGDEITVKDGDKVVCATTVQSDKTWTCTPTDPLADGPHTLTATETDPAGNESDPSAPVVITVDTQAPAAPVITGPKDGDKVGDNTPTVTGTGAESGDVVIVRDGGSEICRAVVQSDKTWTCTPTQPLADGSHTLTATETDPAGNVSAPSAPVTITVDTQAPSAPVITGPKNGDKVGDNTPTVTGTASEPGNVVIVRDGGSEICRAVVQSDKTWTCTPADPLADGSHTLTATETDPAGNVSAPSAPVVITVDTEAPAAPAITGPKDGDKVNDNTPTVTGTGEEPGDEITVKDGDKVVCATTVQSDKTWTCTPADPLGDGDHELTATETDPAGNVSDPSTPVVITVDTEAPSAPEITGPKDGDEVGDNTPTVTGTGEEPGDEITVKDGDKVVCATTVQSDKTWTCTLADPLDDGDHTLTATETDPAGNESDPSDPVVITVDTVQPGLPEVDPSNGSEITGTSDPETTVTVKDPDGIPLEGCVDVPVDENGHFSCTPTKRPGPGTEFEVVSKDKAGNESDPVKFAIQSLQVEVAYQSRQPGENQVVTGYHFNPGEEACLVVTSDPWEVGCQIVGADGSVTFSFVIPDGFDAGTHLVTITGEVSGSASTSFEVAKIQVKTGGAAAGHMAPYGLLMGLSLSVVGLWVASKRRTQV